jgi:hypothetical protein
MRRTLLGVLAVLSAWPRTVSAAADEVIVNIDARTNNELQPISRSFGPGTYDVTPIGMDQGGSYNAYMYDKAQPDSWVHAYTISSSQFPTLWRGDGRNYLTGEEALAHAEKAEFELSAPGDVQFYIEDTLFEDNIGGISLKVVPREIFVRGDANASNAIDIADAIFTLSYLFANGDAPTCFDAADANDSGEVDIADVVTLLRYLFAVSGPLPAPFDECGADPTTEEDELDCASFGPCEGR